MEPLRIGILTVSDRVCAGVYEDRGGPEVQRVLEAALASPWEAVAWRVPDEQSRIEAALVALCEDEACALVLSTGGTGPAPRDCTPEATEAVCDRLLPGFGERMRAVSVATVPTAILSRQVAGIRNRSFVVNLPGRPEAVRPCLEAVLPAVLDGLAHLGHPRLDFRETAG